MTTQRFTFTLNDDDPEHQAAIAFLIECADRSGTLRDIVIAYFNGVPVPSAEMHPAVGITEEGLSAAITRGIVEGLRQSGLSLSVSTNGNGHHAEPVPEPDEDGEDPDDPLVAAMAGMKFEF